MRDRIFYLGFYNNDAIKDENRESFPAADTKMDYVRSVLARVVKQVHIISASKTKNKSVVRGKLTQLNENTDLKTFTSIGSGNVLKRFAERLFLNLQLFFFLVSKIRGDDTLVVYHSLRYMKSVKIAKKIKGFKLIEEVEEIYSYVTGNLKKLPSEHAFFAAADSFLFSTQLLNDAVNVENKPYIVSHGTYSIAPVISERFYDGRIHVVYAGTLDPRKGAQSAIEAAKYLDKKYHIHILGFGTEREIAEIIEMVENISQYTKCKITYDGLKRGDEYIKFLQSCHIGLSTQNPDAAFNATSFPSKILVYLSNNLRVVSIKIPAIETSKVADFIYYYDNQSPQEIAEVISKIDLKEDFDGREILLNLDRCFLKDLNELLRFGE